MNADLADLKPPVDLPGDYLWIVWCFLGFLICLGIIFLLLNYIKKKVKALCPPVVLLPWDKALGLLKAAYDRHLPQQGQIKEFFDLVGDIFRLYCEERYGINAPHMSTEEFLIFMQTTSLLSDFQKKTITQMLLVADMVKFAKHQSTIQDCEDFYRNAINFVEDSRGI